MLTEYAMFDFNSEVKDFEFQIQILEMINCRKYKFELFQNLCLTVKTWAGGVDRGCLAGILMSDESPQTPPQNQQLCLYKNIE